MHGLTRRQVIAGATVAAGAALLPECAVRAAAPAAGKQAPSFYRYKVGSFECTSLSDGARTFPMPDTFVRNVSKDQALAAAEAAFPKGQVVVPFNPQVINTGSKLVLIDAGIGPGVGPSVGLLQAHLAAAGIEPKSTPSSCRTCIPTMPTASRPPTAGLPFPMRRSWRRRRTGRSG
jgi:hypothetical protein